ncbi:LysR family transcriptional regulator [Shimazuella kribbensis]|uniref:LysR family transcriptional regulator n=1 Tax=Shimazuella kribbensis TaxID=139808 RepID=UPI000429BFBE|nr:LysR family transcriptional regulator [Shimazuella kribbensis]
MELLQLHYFRKVAKLEHMTKAAQELHIPQSALSKTISRLEEDLGVPLFDRKGRYIRLNTFGKAYLKKVEIALTALEEGQREVKDLAGMEKGELLIATTTHKCFSGIIGSFLTSYPNIKVKMNRASEQEKVRQLRNGDIDFCITFPPIQQDGIKGISFLTEEILLAVPSTHRFAHRSKVDLSELSDDPFILIEKGNPFREMTDRFCEQAGFTPNVACEVDEHSAIGHFIPSGVGVAFLPETLVDKRKTSYHFVHIHRPVCRRIYQLAWMEDRYISTASLKFREFFVQHFTSQQRNRI